MTVRETIVTQGPVTERITGAEVVTEHLGTPGRPGRDGATSIYVGNTPPVGVTGVAYLRFQLGNDGKPETIYFEPGF